MDKIKSDRNIPIDYTITIKIKITKNSFTYMFYLSRNSYDIPVRKDNLKLILILT